MKRDYRVYLDNILESIEWKKIAGARDILAHEYFGVRLERIWETVGKDLPKLKEQIKNLLKESR